MSAIAFAYRHPLAFAEHGMRETMDQLEALVASLSDQPSV
jgi:hypothetical protein